MAETLNAVRTYDGGTSRNFLIAGGGIAGLAAALALARVAVRSRVLERRAQFSEAGAGIQLGPNAVKVLRQLGVLDALRPFAGQPQNVSLRDGLTARILTTLPFGSWMVEHHGAPYLVAHRRDLQDVLLQRARAEPLIEIETGFEVVDVEDTHNAIQVRAANGREHQGDALIAADGVHSTLRPLLFPGSQPRFTGRTAARTVIAAEHVPPALKAFVPNDATGVWLAPGAHVVHYPVRGGREIAVVVIAAKLWSETDWSAPTSRDDILHAIGPFAPELREALGVATEWRKWALFDAEPLPTWSRGRAVLIGDAAHPVLPFLAQGGGLALEDAVTLAHAVAPPHSDLAERFEQFAKERTPRTTRILEGARRNGRIYHLGGLSARARNTVMRYVPTPRLMASYDWLYGFEPPNLVG